MNMHVPQSLEAATELEEIAAVPHQIVSPRHAMPLIGIVQDTLVGSFRLTREHVKFNRREFMNLMMWNKNFDGMLPKPKAQDGVRFTGHQVISTLLPPINMEMNNSSKKKVVIKEGEVIEGQFDKSIYSKASEGIIHVAFNDYGSKTTVNLIDSLQNTIEQFLVYNGFSVGISDLIADMATKDQMQKKIKDKKSEVETLLLQIHQDLFDNNTGKTNQAEFEDRAFGLLNQALIDAGDVGQASLANENRMTAMIRAGSKGSSLNIGQMIACVGQQSIEGKRIPYGFEDRTLPHFKRYDDSASARGFVENSFISGLTPQEFFFHAMSGREGLIDTAVKTAETGYVQRQLVKAMEDAVVQYDGTVRDATMNIIQFHYGEDGINATKIEKQNMDMVSLTDEQIRRDFALEGVDLTEVLAEGTDRGDDVGVLTAFANQVKADRAMIVEGVFNSREQGAVYAAVNLDRLLRNVKAKFGLNDKQRTSLTPLQVLAGIDAVLAKTQTFHRMWAALLRYTLAPLKMIVRDRFTPVAFNTLCEMLVTKNWQAWVQPGEQVGIIAAQSIGEPATQMTLNTFHLAGVASKSNVTRGVPRLKELLKVTQNPKAISLTIPLKPEFANSKEKAREVSQQLELTLLRDMCVKTAIYYDPDDRMSVLEEDRELIAFYKLFEMQQNQGDGSNAAAAPVWSKYMLRLELNRQTMFDKNITMDDIHFVLSQRFGNELNMMYSDFNSQKLVMRMRLNMKKLAGGETGAPTDMMTYYKRFLNKLLNSVIIRGMPGIKAATFRKGDPRYRLIDGKYEKKEEYILDTDGTNFLDVMNHPAVDGNRVYSTHVHDIYTNLGIEATRTVLLNEINTLFDSGTINYRHLGLLVDVMCRSGRLMSVDRYGINKLNIGPLAKASFEETEHILLNAAVFGEMDPVTGVSANIMTGQPIRGGTAFADILLDEVALLRLQKNLPPSKPLDFEEDAPEDEDVDEKLVGDATDICSGAQLRMNLTMPARQAVVFEEDDVELAEIPVEEED